MVDRYQQQELASAQVGLPREDHSGSTAAKVIAETANAQRDAVLQQASKQFAQAETNFSQLSQNTAVLEAAMHQARKVEQERMLQESLANAKYTASVKLTGLSERLQADNPSNPAAARKAGDAQVDQVLSELIPKDASPAVQARYRQHLLPEKAQFQEGLITWQGRQEKVNSNNQFQMTVANSLLSMQKAGTTDGFLKEQQKFVEYANSTARTPDRELKVKEALATAAKSHVEGIALRNPADIDNAIKAAAPFVSNKEIGEAVETAKKRTKELAAEAVHVEMKHSEFSENVLEGKLTSMVQGTLQKANTSNPGPGDVTLLRLKSVEVLQTGRVFDAQLQSLEKQIKANPNDEVLIQRHGSIVKQKKAVETAARTLQDKADTAAKKIQDANEIAARRAEAAANRQIAEGFARENRLGRIENATMHAQMDAELAAVKAGPLAPGVPKVGVSKGYEVVKNFPGLQVSGNIDLKNRPIVDNPDGSYGTEFSLSFNDGKHEVLIPTIFDGKHHTEQEAIDHYRNTGQHLGKFASGDTKTVDQYAEQLHSREILVNGKPYHGAEDTERLSEFSRAKLKDMKEARTQLELAQDLLRSNPSDKMAAAKVSTLAAKVSALAHATMSADRTIESIANRNEAAEKQKAVAAAKLYQVAGVPLYTTLLQRAQTPFGIHEEKGRIKIDGVKLDDARVRLDQLDKALTSVSEAGMLTQEQLVSVKNTLEDRRQKLNAWASQDGWGSSLSNINPLIQDAYNQPISDAEKRGLAVPGTPQYQQLLHKYKSNLDAAIAAVHQTHTNPKDAIRYLNERAKFISDQAWQATLSGKTGGR
jgi:hypothetical protein